LFTILNPYRAHHTLQTRNTPCVKTDNKRVKRPWAQRIVGAEVTRGDGIGIPS